jgi:hypothetical protein
MTAMLTVDPILQVTAGITVHDALDFSARYAVAGYRGVAFYLLGYATEWTEETWTLDCMTDGHVYPDDHDETCYLYGEPEEVERGDMVRAVMVGDDRVHVVDVADLTEIGEEDYCPGCGQVGCKAYG